MGSTPERLGLPKGMGIEGEERRDAAARGTRRAARVVDKAAIPDPSDRAEAEALERPGSPKGPDRQERRTDPVVVGPNNAANTAR